jgi:MFS superfamily sulfate permease-like transporter
MNLASFTAENIRKDALAGTITGMVAVPLSIGICLMSEYPIQTGLITVIFACIIGFITFLCRQGNFVGVPGIAAGLAPVLALGVHKFGFDASHDGFDKTFKQMQLINKSLLEKK